MCYPKPLGRCSRVAKNRLAKAIESGNKDKIKAAEREYYLTPAGIKELEETNQGGRAWYYKRLRHSRREALKHAREQMLHPDEALSFESFRDDARLDAVSSDISALLNSTPFEYDAKETILSMKESEETAIAEAAKIRDAEIAAADNIDGTRQEIMAAKRMARAKYKATLKQVKTNWRQMEWLGFHFENTIVRNTSTDAIGGAGPKIGNVTIDTWVGPAGNKAPCDIKVHSMHSADGRASVEVPLNDKIAVDKCIEEYGVYYLMVAKTEAKFDETGDIKAWTDELKGGQSRVSRENAENGRNSRLRKKGASVRTFSLYAITDENKHLLKNFSQGRQHSGAARNAKYGLNFGDGGIRPVMQFHTPYGREVNEAERG